MSGNHAYRIKHHYNWEGYIRYQPQVKVKKTTQFGLGTWFEWEDIGPQSFIENGGYKTELEAEECITQQSHANKEISFIYGVGPLKEKSEY